MDISKSKVLYRKLIGDMPIINHGEGSVVVDDAGNKYIDLSCGPCCSSLGHSNEEVLRAMRQQMKKIPNVFSGFWASTEAESAAEEIAKIFAVANPGWFGRAIFQSGGGEAVDLACKLAAQYWREGGEKRNVIAARQHCFHGVGLLPFSLSDYYPRYELIDDYHQSVRDNYVLRFHHPVTGYKDERDLSITRKQLETHKDKIAAVIIEPVGGPPIGAFPDSRKYLQGLRKICDDLNILLIFDEILCGSGRCGALSVAELFGVWPDIVILGKGITSGYQPVSVICLSEKVIERLNGGSKQVMFGTTYCAHTIGCAAVRATLQYMTNNRIFERVRNSADTLYKSLSDNLEDLSFVEEIRGMGYLWGIRLFDPKEHRSSFPPEVAFHAEVRDEIFKHGAVVYSKGQTIFGHEDFIIIAPTLDASDFIINAGIERVRAGAKAAYVKYQMLHAGLGG